MPALPNDEEQSGNSLYAAIARSATRGAALYFSRPVRLFRPSKVSGWQILKGLASQHGASLSPQYLTGLIKQQGFMVIPRHFVPPMMINLALGSVLWFTYSETSTFVSSHISSSLCTAAIAGGVAGGVQALVAAPAENVRYFLESGSPTTGWSHVWKEVFRGTEDPSDAPKEAQIREARQVRQWMREVGELAGRGWDGWGWGCAKDICGFALFFTIFEFTRRVAQNTKAMAEAYTSSGHDAQRIPRWRKHTPRVVHAITLVSGGAGAGLAYEVASRPWDIARKAVDADRMRSPQRHPIPLILLRKFRDEGWHSFFVNPAQTSHGTSRGQSALRTLGRVGPWGVGFLVWEAFGPGIS